MGIAGRGRIAYIDGRNPEPAKTSGVWDTWFLEDNQVKTWIANSVSADIQPLILRQMTVRDMWVILEQMYGQKKKAIRTYQLMKTVYGLWQGNLSIADYYGALKAKWEDLDYCSDITWHYPQDQALYVAKEWENRVFLFLAGLNDEFKGVRSLIPNSREVSSIEDVYSCVEAEEQRRLVTTEGKRDLMSYNERSALVSCGPGGTTRSLCRCTHRKKTGHTVDFCWDLHPEKKGNKGRTSNGKPNVSEETKSSGGKVSISAEQLRELRAYLGRIDVNQVEASDETKANHALAIVGDRVEFFSFTMANNIKSDGSTEYKMAGNSFSYGTTIKLNGSNYEIWSRVFIMSVAGRRKKYILEEDEPTEKKRIYAAWDEDNYIVMSWIMNSVESHIAPTIAYYTKAKEMWSFLRKTYSHATNVIKILQLEEELCNIRQGDQDLSQYFATLTAAYEQLKTLRPPCQHCYVSHFETGMVAKFLSGLSPKYFVAKSQILTGSDLPDLADNYNRLSRLAVTLSQNTHDTSVSALVISGERGPSSFGGTRGRNTGRGAGHS
ncbi:hypothetical protein EJ110_NYTH48327 [Nymphaea thermarum]|nr:hypothetical protein EJ110_NYTH48327 [Nymphaea thermarum]